MKNRKELDVELAKSIIKDCSKYYNTDILVKTRVRNVIEPRMMAIKLIFEFCNTLKDYDIAELFNIHRTSALHSKNSISNLIEYDGSVKSDYVNLAKLLCEKYDFYNIEAEIGKAELIFEINKLISGMGNSLLEELKTKLLRDYEVQ